MPEPTHDRGAARAAIAAAHLAAFACIWVAAALITGGPVRWYLSGGMAMHALLAVAVAQTAAGIWLGLRQLDTPLPASLHLALPATAVLLGLGASSLDANQAFDALVGAPPDLRLQTLTAAVAAAELPQQLGALIGGLGCLALAVTAAVVGARNRGTGWRPRAQLLIAGLGVGAAALVFALHGGDPDVGIGPLAWLTACAAGATLAMAVAAAGVVDLVERDHASAPAVGFSLAVLAALGALGAVLLQGLAIAAHGRIEGLQAAGMAPSDMATILIARGARATELGNSMTLACVSAVAVPALVMLGRARRGLRPWLVRRPIWALLTIATVAAAAVAHARFRAEIEARVAATATDLRPHTPEGLTLAGSTSDKRYDQGAERVLILKGDAISNLAGSIGPWDEPQTLERLATLLEPPAASTSANPDDLAAHLVTAAAVAPPDCPEPVLEPFALIADGTASAREVMRFAGAMRDRGACRMRIMVRPRQLLDSPDLVAQQDAMRRELREHSMLAALFDAAAQDWHFVFAYLTTKLPEATDDFSPLVLRIDEEAVRLVASGDPDQLVEATRRGRVDRDALALALEDLKATYFAQRRIYVDRIGDASLQDLIDVLDAARQEVLFEDNTVGTFDKVVLVTSPVEAETETPEPDAPADATPTDPDAQDASGDAATPTSPVP